MKNIKFLLLNLLLVCGISVQSQTNLVKDSGNQFLAFASAEQMSDQSDLLRDNKLGINTNIPELLRRPENNEVRIERYKTIVLRDGVKIYADVYLPAKPGKYPTIVVRTCYGVQRDGGHQDKIRFAQQGYAVVFADIRGRYESEGQWDPFRDESKDGYDVIEWAAAQSFSNGKIATGRLFSKMQIIFN